MTAATTRRRATPMPDHAHTAPDLLTAALGIAAAVAHSLQAAVAPILILCTILGCVYSTIRFVADWPEIRAKFGRNREATLQRRLADRAAELERANPPEVPRPGAARCRNVPGAGDAGKG